MKRQGHHGPAFCELFKSQSLTPRMVSSQLLVGGFREEIIRIAPRPLVSPFDFSRFSSPGFWFFPLGKNHLAPSGGPGKFTLIEWSQWVVRKGLPRGMLGRSFESHQLSIELFGLWGTNQENLDPNTFILKRFWVVPMQSFFMKSTADPFCHFVQISNANLQFRLENRGCFQGQNYSWQNFCLI